VKSDSFYPVPRTLLFLLGIAVFLSLLYVIGRYYFLQDDMQLPPNPGFWKLSFVLDPMAVALVITIPILSIIPTLFVRRYVAASWTVFGISILSSLPIFFMVDEWGRKVIWANSDAGYVGPFLLISALLFGASAIIATIWAAIAKRSASLLPHSRQELDDDV
jgi:hypothetical protein